MKICENGAIREMTTAEITAIEDMATRAEAEEKHRALSLAEVYEMLVRTQINTLTVDDQTAYRMRDYYPEWKSGVSYAKDYKFTYKGELYKVLTPHTSQDTWLPEAGTESLYTRIDEQHEGSKYDPIPYNGNMALENGKYYSQDSVLYLCNRDTGNPIYNKLSDLVGIYVEII